MCGWHGAAGLLRSAGAWGPRPTRGPYPWGPAAASDSELRGGEGALRKGPA
jgi:hypothetical protein